MQETRVALRYVGQYNPGSVQEFTNIGGYNGLRKALGMTREGIVEEVKASGLIGRGGAGLAQVLNGPLCAVPWQIRNISFAMPTKVSPLQIRIVF